ncbi:hypothetical protein PSTG_14458 [Puccinia striiformis f. sp. tritici PST-78]|uniref:MULE transposase domain-containing protein n=1 Tax=Puccinia striiformis f. sp. tritici PST-78 TaxID=1165861 RepID=A0A0L0UZ18_9BASI|nr:hypothetical protein PSTG_14458 [Puccinia striiformis f. sp. tritici PST-78]
MDFSSVPTTARNHCPEVDISMTQDPPQVDISIPGKVATEVAPQVEPAEENAEEVQLEEQHPLIPAPPEQSFGSRDECFESIQTWARINRFAISTARSYTVNDEVRVIYRCDKSGVYRPHRKDKKDSTKALTEENGTSSKEPATARKPPKGPPKNANKSRKTNCPFKMVLTHNPTTKMWDLVVDEAAHNHAPSDHPSAHYMHRRFTIEQKSTINKWTNAGVMPLKVKNGMMQDKSTPLYANLRAFHNLNYKERQKDRRGEFPLATLIDSLKANGFYYKVKSTLDEETGICHLNAVFFSLPESMKLARNHSFCLFIDATYKTNWFKMPLLHVTGINSTNKSFTIAFCFINTEKEEDFTWALEQVAFLLEPLVPSVILTDKEQALMTAIEKVFPTTRNLLCQWHMGKNLWSHCRPILGDEPYLSFCQAWNFLLVSNNPKQYEKNFQNLAASCSPEVMQYMSKNWIPLADRFVKYLISNVLHFGNVNTSRVESLHAAIKRFLKGANSSMPTTIFDMQAAVKHQLHELVIDCATQKQVHINNLPQVLKKLGGKISHHAIQSAQCLLLSDTGKSPNCPNDCNYESYMGMPCSHRMRKLESEGKSLNPEDFHTQWHLPTTPADTILPPLSQAEANTNEDYEQQFLQEVFERFQKLPTHEKPGYLANFTRLLDQTHSLTQIEDPLEQPHKGRSRGPTKKTKTESARSTKRDPSAFEHQLQKNKVGRPRKVIDPIVVEPPKKRGRPQKVTTTPVGATIVGNKRKQGSGAVKGNKKNKSSDPNSESCSATESENDDLPDIPLEIVTRSGRVINCPSKSGATTVKTTAGKVKSKIDSGNNEAEYLPDAPEAQSNDRGEEELDLPVDGNKEASCGEEALDPRVDGDKAAALSDSDDEEEGNVWKKFNQAHCHYSAVSKPVRHSISKLHEVDGDGHCGFRAAAVSMGDGEEAWREIRKALVDEMDNNEVYKNEVYLSHVSDSIQFARLRSNLNYFRSPARSISNWINFPRHGDLLSDAFKRPVIHISNMITLTYLPLSYGPTTNPPIFVVFLEGKNHYNAFEFEGCIYAAPAISPGWFKWRGEAAIGWEQLIQINHDEWNRRFPQEPAGSPKTIDISEIQ